MTVFVDDATLRDAQDRAARLPLGPVEQQRWREVAAYGAARRPDPNPERAAELRDLLGSPARTTVRCSTRQAGCSATR